MAGKNVETIYALSPQQQGMLVECLAAYKAGFPGLHVEQFACSLNGGVDLQLLKRAWQQVVDLHPVLRTAFVWKDQEEPYQVVLRQVEFPLEYHDWRDMVPEEQPARLQAQLVAERMRGFGLGAAPLSRVAIFQTAAETYRLIWTFHHIILDGWSTPLVLNQVFSIYLALRKGQVPHIYSGRPYRDYIAWLRKHDLSDTRRYWQETLHGFVQPTSLGMESDQGVEPGLQDLYGAQMAHVSEAATRQLQSVARQHRLTLNTLIQGAWTLLLSRYSGHEDVVFGVTVSGRPAELPEVESMVGQFISTLPLRVKVPPTMPLLTWLQEIQRRHQGLEQHGYCSVGQIRQWSQMPGKLPLYESLLVYENYPVDFSSQVLAESETRTGHFQVLGSQTNYALTFLVTLDKELHIRLVYRRERIHTGSVPKLLEHFTGLLERMARNPEPSLATFLGQIPPDEFPKVRTYWGAGAQAAATAYVAPRTPTEQTLARIWAEALSMEVARVGVQHSFFELGGYSLLAIEMISKVRDTFQIELPLRFLFEAPTIADLAVVVAQKQAEQADGETLEQILAELENRVPASTADDPLPLNE